ncbi:RICIN domain-containing protein [Octadecabacter sp. CECT 8868]|uniref:ricin-type beta-trefoil lectin domain protein n=1 Tax=Octadecabacter algicola TaxID=2909342 RepID=UPI001F1D1493|nr:ricin-type beta-trefoil lectin domain protein [Octadecabacter algicola]MCF2904258.1 RICIN domain-containing protein [Octadecabacter algicola]
MMRFILPTLALPLFLMAQVAHSEAPVMQTPAPVIYLADNLDEADSLGWCIDTLGRGFAEELQAHSCNPQGGDVQFTLLEDSGLIRSVEYPDYCAEVLQGREAQFGLTICDAENPSQQFRYDRETLALSPANDETLCMSVGSASRSAGPFMSRDLLLEGCADIDPDLRAWIIVNE